MISPRNQVRNRSVVNPRWLRLLVQSGLSCYDHQRNLASAVRGQDRVRQVGDVLDKIKKKLDEASTQIDQTGVRTRAINRQLPRPRRYRSILYDNQRIP